MKYEIIDLEAVKLLYRQYIRRKDLNLEQKICAKIERAYSYDECIGVVFGEYQRVVKMLRSLLLINERQREELTKLSNLFMDQKLKLKSKFDATKYDEIILTRNRKISNLKAEIAAKNNSLYRKNLEIIKLKEKLERIKSKNEEIKSYLGKMGDNL